METCESSAKSCSKLAYQVVDWGDYYFKLGCSETEAKAETEVAKACQSLTLENILTKHSQSL